MLSPTDSGAVAVRTPAPLVVDGRDDDPFWRSVPVISGFKQWQPTEGKTPRFRTEARVAYDAANLYVFVRAFDPHPDSIIKLLERRDTFTPSDMIWIFVDSYHDRRTGYEFGVNAAGVKIDQAIYDDGNEDGAWDAVWDVATRIDSLGWTAEFRIPLSQMRYGTDSLHTFGFTIDRDIYRYAERVSWPMFSQAKTGMVSQFGALTGLADLETPRRIEAMPYVVTKNASTIVNNAFTQRSSVTVGGDLKYRVASNLTLDATVNPDFGQVEADPAVLNLSAYESFFDERRPFFVAGRGLFRFDVNCSAVNCNSEGLYYSRRIGRTPELAGTYGDTLPLQPTPILGAAKLIGRFPSGLTIGVLDAATQREASPGDTTYEPAANFAVVRASQDLRQGNSGVGAMLSAVNRRTDAWSAPYLASSAYVGAVDFRHRLLGNNYEISGSLDGSRVQGSRDAILARQTDAVHYYQRPDAGLLLDSSRTSLGGDAEELKFGKVGGKHLMFESAYQRRSPGFEINDLGYLRRADQQSWSTWVGFFDRNERKYYNRFQWNNNWWQYWTAAGLPLEAAYNTNMHITFRNNWGWHMGGTIGQLGTTYDDRGARGGPAIRQDSYLAPWLFINGNDRRALVPNLSVNYFRGDAGRNSSWNVSPGFDYKALGRFSSSLSFNWSHNIADNQWYGRYTDAQDASHYTFAHLDQTTTSATIRLNYTFTPSVTLQGYLQPFVSKGTYSNVRQLSATPRASAYDDRYAPYDDPSVTADPGGFNYKQLQSNLVFRWEYSPGSSLFVVWNQGRQGFNSAPGAESFQGDVRDLLRLHPANTFLVKMSYWLNR
ncbi:MAG: carbohydrate binding family 9 domain-containing protein [Gemmatimonadota bacterium]|nr:carbohydrate binding family 9 domain-containing protein [Gemmatimonadota bacterium]